MMSVTRVMPLLPDLPIDTARNDLGAPHRQRSLNALAHPRAHASQNVGFSSVVRITGMAFGWIGSTTAFGAVVRKP